MKITTSQFIKLKVKYNFHTVIQPNPRDLKQKEDLVLI